VTGGRTGIDPVYVCVVFLKGACLLAADDATNVKQAPSVAIDTSGGSTALFVILVVVIVLITGSTHVHLHPGTILSGFESRSSADFGE